MRKRPLAHLSDDTLLASFESLLAQDRKTTVEVLEHIVEIDTRKLWAPAGYSSMFRFCIGKYQMSEDVAYKRIRAARAASRCPEILERLADGRLHLAGLVELAPYLRDRTATELLEATEHKTRREIQRMLADRFPRPDLPTRVVTLIAPSVPDTRQLAPGPVGIMLAPPVAPTPGASEPVGASMPAPARLIPLAPKRIGLQTTIDGETEDLLLEAQDLLGQVGTSRVPEVLKILVRLGVEQLRKQKFGATDAPRPARDRNPDSRYVPCEVRRAVWNRDGGRCTFTSEDGHRCEERSGLEFDHIKPFAIGGDSSASNVRLLCSTHNQYEAERTYGADFMSLKRGRAAS